MQHLALEPACHLVGLVTDAGRVAVFTFENDLKPGITQDLAGDLGMDDPTAFEGAAAPVGQKRL
jgi:hypothetical protein